ncbi:dTDP-4-dehydrorhamnose reductase [bacterium]|jgi:dTDP-4-dehydrorhamnose reductase|nr:dTDP-4-dehydrorhamnose reductase [bacterium]
MKVILVGASGMLGEDVHEALTLVGHQVIPFTSKTIDITQPDSIQSALEAHSDAEVLINSAAFTKVDQCETKQDLAMAVNGEGPGHIATFCNANNIHMIHYSTDYVFDGTKNGPYTETDTPNPVSIYGQSKLAGELTIQKNCPDHTIFRVQWLYGHNGHHFIKTVVTLAESRDTLRIVSDQTGTPTWTGDIAKMTVNWIDRPLYDLGKPDPGIYHYRPEGVTTWANYTRQIFQVTNRPTQVQDIRTEDYPLPAKRPSNGQLNTDKIKALGITPPDWKISLETYLKSH